jgi:ATP-binding cassette subfamily B protein
VSGPQPIEELAWPAERLGEALTALAQQSGLQPAPLELASPRSPSEDDLGRWLDAAAAAMELEIEPVEAAYGEVEALVGRSAPALVRLPGTAPRFLALLTAGRRRVRLVGPDHRSRQVEVAVLRDLLRRDLEADLASEVEGLLAGAAVPARRRERVRAALLAARLGERRVGGVWLLDLPPHGRLGKAARRARLPGRGAALVGAHLAQHVLLLLSWWVLGLGVLQGRLDRAWLIAWALLLLTVIPFRALELWSAGVLMLGAGRLFKRRLMTGALHMTPEETRHQGAGQLLGRIVNAEALEFLALTGAHVGAITLAEIALALPVLVAGAGGWPHALALLAWVVLAGWLSRRYFALRKAWTTARLEMTHDLVEQMVGHRTRLAQLGAEHWHEREDRELERYLALSVELDRRAAHLRVLIPRGWLLLSLIALAGPFISGSASTGSLAVALGGALFVYWSFSKMVRGLADLSEAAVAWGQVEPILRAASRREEPATAAALLPVAPSAAGTPRVVLEAHDLGFRYGERADPAVAGATLTVRQGERWLLEGPSGGGKSTFASLLAGLRRPQSGLLLLEGLDRHSLGADGWRRRAVAAPQFQENHVLTETLAFNLLMGREWPPRPGDLEEAEAVCRELGLGDLLDRMPAGLQQMVGESGWQLSHGEKSRVYIARALLQQAELVILDESFAALDPESLRQALASVLKRAPTLFVIAHP